MAQGHSSLKEVFKYTLAMSCPPKSTLDPPDMLQLHMMLALAVVVVSQQSLHQESKQCLSLASFASEQKYKMLILASPNYLLYYAETCLYYYTFQTCINTECQQP